MEQGNGLRLIAAQTMDDIGKPVPVSLNLSPFPSEEAIEAWTANVTSLLFEDAETPNG